MAYRLYGEVPQLGQWDWLTGTADAAIAYAQAEQQAKIQEAAAEAQKDALAQQAKTIAAQTALVKQQTLLQQATSAARSVVSTAVKNPIATGTILALGAGAVALFFILRKK